jgi:hypothetical protein
MTNGAKSAYPSDIERLEIRRDIVTRAHARAEATKKRLAEARPCASLAELITASNTAAELAMELQALDAELNQLRQSKR